MRYLMGLGLVVCLVWLAALFPWLILVAAVVFFLSVMADN